MKRINYKDIKPFDFKDLRIRELTPEDSKSASIAEIEVEPGKSHPETVSKKSDKLYFCLEGSLEFKVNEVNLVLNPKDTLFIRKGEWFSYLNNNPQTARLLLVHIPPFDINFEEFKE